MRSLFAAFVYLVFASFLSPVLAEDRLDGDAIKKKIIGNTLTIVTMDLELATGFIQDDGNVRGRIGGERADGKWYIKDSDQLCFDLPDQTFDICNVVFDDGKHVRFFNASGDPGGRAEILKGNPYGL